MEVLILTLLGCISWHTTTTTLATKPRICHCFYSTSYHLIFVFTKPNICFYKTKYWSLAILCQQNCDKSTFIVFGFGCRCDFLLRQLDQLFRPSVAKNLVSQSRNQSLNLKLWNSSLSDVYVFFLLLLSYPLYALSPPFYPHIVWSLPLESIAKMDGLLWAATSRMSPWPPWEQWRIPTRSHPVFNVATWPSHIPTTLDAWSSYPHINISSYPHKSSYPLINNGTSTHVHTSSHILKVFIRKLEWTTNVAAMHIICSKEFPCKALSILCKWSIQFSLSWIPILQ